MGLNLWATQVLGCILKYIFAGLILDDFSKNQQTWILEISTFDAFNETLMNP
jgi:hypothetical protein